MNLPVVALISNDLQKGGSGEQFVSFGGSWNLSPKHFQARSTVSWPHFRSQTAAGGTQRRHMSAHCQIRTVEYQFYAAFETLELARDFEHYLKTGSGHAFSKRHLGLRV
jgi:hypothetical protein